MSIQLGARLGPYEVTAQIGAGGMGEVYRARDTKLRRDVALKVLPDLFARDPDRLARFTREAHVLASLNHPNIAAIHGIEEAPSTGSGQAGVTALVLELVEGPTLADRVAGGAVPLDEALKIAGQIADALDAAHEKGVVHRDLKPANIKVREDGTVKVLDFGLAKALTDESRPDATMSPTLTAMASKLGVIVGTAAYMSPEQAKGKTVDKRTDIWAFGCVLYEMLTGTRAFAGDDVTDFIVSVMTKEPDWTRLPASTPPRIVELLKRCLKKDQRERLRDIADAKMEIESGWFAPAPAPHAAVASRRRAFSPLMLAATVVITVAITSAFWIARGRVNVTPPMPMHLTVPLTSVARANWQGTVDFDISLDGRWFVYETLHEGKPALFLQDMHDSAGRVISGSEGAAGPFFSPDSRYVAFASGATLKKVPVSGGAPTAVCELSISGNYADFAGGAWGEDNRIVFVPNFNSGIWSVSADGGTPELLLKTDEAKDRIAYTRLQALPGNRGVLFTLSSGTAKSDDDQQVGILETGKSEPRLLPIHGLSMARYVSSGHLVYNHQDTIFAVPFDLATLAVTGSPTPVVEGLWTMLSGTSDFAVSGNGTLLYQPRGPSAQGGTVLALVDRRGQVRLITDDKALPAEFAVSPDGRQIAARVVSINDDLWTYDVADGTSTRLTFEPLDELLPQWTPDGKRIAFGSRVGRMHWKAADGTGQREEFPRGQYPRYPGSFSPDGKTLAFTETHPKTKNDIWLMPLDGDRKAAPLLNTNADERSPKFSPNGRWLAYSSDETGRDEIWVRPMGAAGAPGAKKRVSPGGGSTPAWNRNGRELFFLKGDALMSVALDGEMNRLGAERVVLEAPHTESLKFQLANPYYDVMPDAERFVFLLMPTFAPPTRFNVMVNWLEELKQRVPTR